MNKFKNEVAKTLEVLRATLKVKWMIAVAAVIVLAIVGICGGDYHAVARIILAYYSLIIIESIIVGIWSLHNIATPVRTKK